MSFEKFFRTRGEKMENHNTSRSEWGNTGALPALGNHQGYPSMPKIRIHPSQQRVSEPSPEAVIAANETIQQYSFKKTEA